MWGWMKKELKAVESWRLGWAHPEGLGTWLAQLPTSRDAQGYVGFFCFGLPHMASAPCLCIRQGLGESDPFLRSVSWVLSPFPHKKMCSLCKVPFWFFYC